MSATKFRENSVEKLELVRQLLKPFGQLPWLSARNLAFTVVFMMGSVFFGSSTLADEFVIPPLTGPVVDEAGVLNSSTKSALDTALRALEASGGSQINVLTLSSLHGLPIEQASIKIVDNWKLGRSKSDMGALLLIAPNDRKLRIEVGQGLEGVLTDADSKRIIDQSIVPLIRGGDFNSAVLVGVFQITRKTDPNFDLSPYLEGKIRRQPRGNGGGSPLRTWMVIIISILFFLFLGRGRRGGGIFYGGGGFGGGSGGSSGGGWSGGGGGFSGGGASGDW